MAIAIGRTGYLGVGIETTPGQAVSPAIYLQYTDISMRGHHEPIEITSSKASRLMDKDSVVGKKWSEGDVAIDADVISAGYFCKMALGNELYEAGTPSTHTFYVAASGNTPRTATFVYGRDTDVEQYTNVAMNELKLEVSDALVKLTGSFQGQYPTDGVTQTVTTTSGTHISFKDMSVQFGNDLTTALQSAATPVSDFKLSIANNLETIYRSGSNTVSTIQTKGLRVTGSYKIFFENLTDRNAYYNLTKRAMYVTMSGNNNESMKIRIPRFRLSEGEIATGLDDYFVVNCSFVAEDFVDGGTGTRLVDIVMENDKASLYASA